MTDPLDNLKRALDRATPEPDAERRKVNMARAMELFDQAQESAAEPRRTHDRLTTWAGIGHGGRHMLSTLTSRPVLIAAAGLVAVGFAALFVVLSRETAPRPAEVVAEADASPPGPLPYEPAPLRLQEPEELEVAEIDITEVADLELFDLPEAPAPAPVAPVEALQRRRQPVPALPPPAAEPLEGAITVTAERPMVDKFSVTAGSPVETETLPPPAPEPRPTGPRPRVVPSYSRAIAQVAADRAVAGELVVRAAPQPRSTEAFANEPASPLKIAGEEPVSTFSIDVDTASYSVVRSSLMNGYLPVAEAVRVEEMLNYFPYAYPAPEAGEAPFRPTVTVAQTPWNADTLLMTVGLQGRLPATDDRPPLNLVFLIDTSGSMNRPNKLPLLKQSFRLMLGRLRPEDEVAIVTYAGSAGRPLDAIPATERGEILSALDLLNARGSTAGAAGIQLAYRTAAGMAAEGEVTRVILATDGDFNVGISDPEQLKDFIARQRESGIYLSVLGFGRGNLDDLTMQALAQNGNGQAAYIDTLAEAQKVLVDQLTGTLFPLADDVKIQVEFNPAAVAEYRLIGYETRALRREDFNNDRVDAGEIGAGHSVTAIYEVTPVGSPAVLHDPLRYAAPAAEPPGAGADSRRSGELAFLRLRYKAPGEDTSRLIELPIARDAGNAGADQRFAAAIAGFGQLLRGGVYTGGWTWADAIALAEANTGGDRYGYRREAVTLMRLAESLSE